MKVSVKQIKEFREATRAGTEHLSVDVCSGGQKLATEDMAVGLQARRF